MKYLEPVSTIPMKRVDLFGKDEEGSESSDSSF